MALERLTTARVAFLIAFILLFAMATRIPVDTDTWWHIRSGEYTLQNGFIYNDPFSHTRNDTVWINHSWGTQIILYWTYRLMGDAGLALYTSVLATAGMGFVYRMSTGNHFLRAFAMILGAAAAAVFWSPRPQMVSFLLSAVLLFLLHLYKREGIDRLWLIPPLMLLWGNLHAGFSIGFIFMAGMIAGEIAAALFNPDGEGRIPLRGVAKLLLVFVVSIAVIVVNPYTYRMLLVPFNTVGIDVLRDFIQEWQSPNFQQGQILPFTALLLGLLGALGASPKRLMWSDFVLVAGTAFMALVAGRNIAVFAVVATPVLTIHLDAILTGQGWQVRSRKRVPRSFVLVNTVLVLLVTMGAVAKVGWVVWPPTVEAAQERLLPVRVAQHIEATQPDGPMFNSYNWGGYLMWALPDYPVYVDGRTDLYGNDFLLGYIHTYTAQDGWQDTLNEAGVNMVIVEANSNLDRALAQEAGWRLDYSDEQAVLYVRDA